MIRAPHPYRLVVALFAGAALLWAAGTGCATSATEHTVLQGEDLVATGTSKFDKNEIVDSPSFTDTLGLDPVALQAFLTRTPYKRPSFLKDYQSNGIRALDAILATASRYKINPLVFLVRLEMAQGLVGEQFYPAPPSRVEYVFGCGCDSPDAPCDPRKAGLDQQVDCLGRALRTSLDEIAASGSTAGRWGPDQESLSLDGEKVKPADDSTAALYQYSPTVGTGKSGNWVFWNIWQAYAKALNYTPPLGKQGSSGWIGDACVGDGTCGFTDGQCATGDKYPGGLCTAACTKECPSDPGKAQAFCADLGNGSTGYCLPVCNPAAPACREGYNCVPMVAKFGDPGGLSSGVCFNQQ